MQNTPNIWSLMGCVLERHYGGQYDVHIAFRGSRSGSGIRAMGQGILSKGNPDWVTDMDMNTMVQDPDFSTHGSVCRGFSRAVKTAIPSILAILSHIQAQNGAAPANIYVTGHSLGGALATQFATAMVLGNRHGPDGSNLPGNVDTWPWRNLRLITFSAPVAGGKSFQRQFNSRIFCRRVVLSEDPITQDKRGYHVGSEVYITGENTLKVLSYHEPMNVRERLYRKANEWGDDLAGVPGPQKTHADFPWKTYESFSQLYNAEPSLHGGDLNHLLTGLDNDVPRYLGAAATVLESHGAYRSFVRPSRAQARSNTLQVARQRVGNTVTELRGLEINALSVYVQQVREQFGELGKHLSFALMLAELASNPNLDFSDFLLEPRLRECVQ
ncbi:MAG: lipase family protein [Cystobacter sp.]